MSTCHGPSIPHHPGGAFKPYVPNGMPQYGQPVFPSQPPQPPPASAKPRPATKPDPFYGHEVTARLCARFITHLFACPDYPPSSSGVNVKLPQFVAYALYRTKLPSSVTFASLVLLQRLKARFPTARGSSGHRLFLSAFMIASKIICDDTYSNKSWSVVGQGIFQLREINQMEREMCTYLDWELNVDPKTLKEFEAMIRNDFSQAGPYPTYVLQGAAKLAAASSSKVAQPAPSPSAPAASTSPIPSFAPRYEAVGAAPTPVSAPVIPRAKATPSPLETAKSAKYHSTAAPSYPTPTASPVTPGSTRSDSSYVSSDGTPRTPSAMEDEAIRIHDPSPVLAYAGNGRGVELAVDLAITPSFRPEYYEAKRKEIFAIPSPARW